ncbi:MAG: KOW domain-containing RNA-binding protein [Eubacteriaceae bacterium]|nr:KOW domain-containing RNA-binding protein [Eubacteriaceae bacterium]
MEKALEGELEKGQIVISKAGRDKGKHMVVAKVESETYVLLVDGSSRKVASPKRKKVKHIAKTLTVIEGFGAMIERDDADACIRKILYSYKQPGKERE